MTKTACCQNIEIVLHPTTLSYIYIYIYNIAVLIIICGFESTLLLKYFLFYLYFIYIYLYIYFLYIFIYIILYFYIYFFCATLAKRWKVPFWQGFAYFNNNVDSKRHIIMRTAILYDEINSWHYEKKLCIYIVKIKNYTLQLVSVQVDHHGYDINPIIYQNSGI